MQLNISDSFIKTFILGFLSPFSYIATLLGAPPNFSAKYLLDAKQYPSLFDKEVIKSSKNNNLINNFNINIFTPKVQFPLNQINIENQNSNIYEIKQEESNKEKIKENKDNINNKYLELDDNIINYFELNKKEDPNYINNIYLNKSIYLINYPEDKEIVVSYGQCSKLNNSEIIHYCSTKEGSSGSPILLINNQKLIGIHYGASEHHEYNKGTLLIYSIIEFQNKFKNINKDNYIIAEFDIKEDNKNIRIINTYEQYYKKYKFLEYKKEYEDVAAHFAEPITCPDTYLEHMYTDSPTSWYYDDLRHDIKEIMSKYDFRNFAYEYPHHTLEPGAVCSEFPEEPCYFRYDELFKAGCNIRYLPAIETGSYMSKNEITVVKAFYALRNVFGDL